MTLATTNPATRRQRRERREQSPLERALRIGLIFGVVAVYISVVGILSLIDARWIIVGVASLGDAALIAIGLGAGATVAARRASAAFPPLVLPSLVAGAVAGGLLALLALAIQFLDLRPIFIALSPALLGTLTFGLGVPLGPAILVGAGALLGLLGAALSLAPATIRKPVVVGIAFVMVFGVFQELIQIMMQFGEIVGNLREAIYSWEGLSPEGALVIFVLASGATVLWTTMLRRQVDERLARLSPAQQRYAKGARIVLFILLLVLFPVVAGSYIGQVMMLVGLYILMGMGLNLEVGLAGLLDLGFVAFFAVGAYATALLTADSPHALASYTMLPSLSYWAAMPIAVIASIIVGVLFGIPVLGVRGDYLAVATMGLGEIVRVIVQSDMAAPLLAGAQGILQIPKPRIGSFELADPVDLFYLTLAASAVAAYFAWRLENSRLGRAWMAVRDDEDVAQALGINLVKVKLLAYGLGAAFAGLAGSIFAVMLTSIYPSSFQLLISINVLALIIVGGMGSLPGVVVGAVALVGLPELLREFGEFRFLFYGAVLIIMMRIKPEGLWPSATRRRELRAAAGEGMPDDPQEAAMFAAAPSSAAQGSGH
ncbi:branched-chain amino acid transport system permease protein [Rhizobiales bacterium GAS191]|nr:branched-chain amino acid transport system permease protein [Rhizobiales bacterium GAS191]